MGRRPTLKPAPRPIDLLDRSVHEIVRDYPEALVALRRAGVDVGVEGGRPLSDLSGAEDLSQALARVLEWRGHAPSDPVAAGERPSNRVETGRDDDRYGSG